MNFDKKSNIFDKIEKNINYFAVYFVFENI